MCLQGFIDSVDRVTHSFAYSKQRVIMTPLQHEKHFGLIRHPQTCRDMAISVNLTMPLAVAWTMAALRRMNVALMCIRDFVHNQLIYGRFRLVDDYGSHHLYGLHPVSY